MERQYERQGRIKEAKAQVAQLMEFSRERGADGADVRWNREAKREMRVCRTEDRALEARCDLPTRDRFPRVSSVQQCIASASWVLAALRMSGKVRKCSSKASFVVFVY
jgi:hypothetical protein